MKRIFTWLFTACIFAPVAAQTLLLPLTPADARSSAMGYLGGSTTPDAYSIFWCPARIPHSPFKTAFAFSHRNSLLSTGTAANFSSFSGYYSADTMQALSFGLRHYAYGQYDQGGTTINPLEEDISLAYTRRFNYKFSMSLAARYFNHAPGGRGGNAAGAFASTGGISGDLAVSYLQPCFVFSYDALLYSTAGVYNAAMILRDGDPAEDFHQSLLIRAGQSTEIFIDDDNSLMIGYDFNFYPQETTPFAREKASIGVEYRWMNMLMIRGGFGFRQSFFGSVIGAGFGFRYNRLQFDLGYTVADNLTQSYSLPLSAGVTYQISRKHD